MLSRNKITLATVLTAFAIMALTISVYLLSIERIRQHYVAPKAAQTFSNILFDLIKHSEKQNSDLLFSISQDMTNYYHISELAIYNSVQQRVLHQCQENCSQLIPYDLSEEWKNNNSLPQDLYLFMRTINQSNYYVLIKTNNNVGQVFISDTLVSSFLVFFVASFSLYLLFLFVRHWQNEPYQNLIKIIDDIYQKNNTDLRISTEQKDSLELAQALNRILQLHAVHEQQLLHESKKSDKSRNRAISLAQETRQANELLQREMEQKNDISLVLEETQMLLDNILDSMPSAIFTLDQSGYILQTNLLAAQWLSTDAEFLIGKKIIEKIPGLKKYEPQAIEYIKQKQAHTFERLTIKIGQHSIIANVLIYPLQQQQPGGVVVRIDDITEKQQLEEVVVQTDKMKSVGALAAGMAHEINNPLGVILQNVQNIQRRLDSKSETNQKIAQQVGLNLTNLEAYIEQRKLTEFISNVQNAGQRAATIVTSMLQFSRDHKQVKQSVDFHQLIKRAITIANNDYQLKHINLVSLCDELLPAISCVPSEIEQVILNILQNAQHALLHYQQHRSMQNQADNFQPEITISCQTNEKYLQLMIKDNGPGMDADVKKRIFEPFYTTKDIGSGTGLGLSVSYFIISVHHQGQLSVESELDHGSCFMISLPL